MGASRVIFTARGFFYFTIVIAVITYCGFFEIVPKLYMVAIGAAIVAIGEAIRIYAAGYIGLVGRCLSVRTDSLQTGGPYAYVRNPIYLANYTWAIGYCIMAIDPMVFAEFGPAAQWYFVIPAYAFVILSVIYFKIIPHEEEALREKYGEEYCEYCTKVRRIVPHIRNPPDGTPGRCDIELGLKNDKHTIAMHIFFVIMIISLPWWYAILPP